MGSPIIQVEDLTRRYGDFTAVDAVSFDVEEGGFFGFLGPNGAGKTTTMRILATLLKPTSGLARVAGLDVTREPQAVRRMIGFAMQDVSLDLMASANENLQLLGVLYGLSRRASRERAAELIEMVGLTKVADRWVSTFSGGMKRRLDLAGVLMHSPRLLFLDEPTQGLDPHARRVIWDYLRGLNADGSTIFLTTHYMDEADTLCRDLAFIDKGRIIRRGAPAELKASLGGDVIQVSFDEGAPMERVRSILGSVRGAESLAVHDHTITMTSANGGEMVPQIVRELDSAELAPRSLSVAQPSLEDVFVSLVGRSILEDDTQLVQGRDPFVEGRR
jgi:daunorubicin resistance ABC transporter ATP-binding subunit